MYWNKTISFGGGGGGNPGSSPPPLLYETLLLPTTLPEQLDFMFSHLKEYYTTTLTILGTKLASNRWLTIS